MIHPLLKTKRAKARKRRRKILLVIKSQYKNRGK